MNTSLSGTSRPISRSAGRVGGRATLLRWLAGIALALFPLICLAIAGSGLYVPAFAVGLWLLALPIFVTWTAVAPADRRPLLLVVSGAMLIRVMIGAVLLAVMQKAVFQIFDDTVRYDEIGAAIATAWRTGTNLDLVRQYTLWVAGFYYVVAALQYFSDGGPLLIVTFNAAIAGLTVILVNQLAVDFGVSRRTRFLAAAVAGFTPSIVFWASIPLKDTLVSFLFIGGVLAAFHLHRRHGPLALAVLCASIVLLATLRLYGTLFLVFAAVLVLVSTQTWRRRPVWSGLVLAAVAVTQLYSFQGPFATQIISAATDVVELERQQDIYGGGGSAPNGTAAPGSSTPGTAAPTETAAPAPATTGDRISRYLDVVFRLPLAAAFYFVLPIPFFTRGGIVSAAIPEMILWYPCLILAAIGLCVIARRDRSSSLIVVLLVLAMAAVYGTIVSNAGSLMRYRAQGIVLLAIPIAVGFVWSLQYLRERRVGQPRS